VLDTLRGSHHAAGYDHWIFGVHQQLGGFGDGSGIALRRCAHHQLGDAQVLFGDRLFLQGAVSHQHHRLVGRCH
jgi:hypothetical protein